MWDEPTSGILQKPARLKCKKFQGLEETHTLMHACVHAQSCLTRATLWTVAHHVSLAMGFPRQDYWRGLSFPSPGNLPNQGTESTSPAWQADSLPLSHQGSH